MTGETNTTNQSPARTQKPQTTQQAETLPPGAYISKEQLVKNSNDITCTDSLQNQGLSYDACMAAVKACRDTFVSKISWNTDAADWVADKKDRDAHGQCVNDNIKKAAQKLAR